MTFGLLSGLLGSKFSGSDTATTTTQQAAPSNANINQFNAALNNAYNAGLSQGLTQGGSGGYSQAPINIYNYAAGGNAGAGAYNGGSSSGYYGPGSTGGVGGMSGGHSGHHSAGSSSGISGMTGGHGSQNYGNNSAFGVTATQPGYSHSSHYSNNAASTNMVPGTTAGGTTSTMAGAGGLGGILGSVDSLESNLLGGLLGGAQGGSQSAGLGGMISGLLGGIGGGGSGSAGAGGLGGFGGILGGAASGVHQLAETAISATGMGSLFAPIDDAVIHPILWDPISQFTGTDVSKHPDGIADVSDPLGVRS